MNKYGGAPRYSRHSPPPPADSSTMALLTGLAAELHSNGEESTATIERVERTARALNLTADVDLSWDDVTVELVGGVEDVHRQVAARPTALNMRRVTSVIRLTDRLADNRTSVAESLGELERIRKIPSASLWTFVIACAVAAAGLAMIFGAREPGTVVLIAVSAAVGALVRRGIGRLGGSTLTQAFVAAAIAGVLGATAVNLDISSSLRLAAVCPCMILVPGPHILNSTFDIAALRVPLGLARGGFALLTVVAIGGGLAIGLAIGGSSLVQDPEVRDIAFWTDVVTAGVVAICYAVFYSATASALVLVFFSGAVVHAMHWVATDVWHLSTAAAAGISCLLAGILLVPLARWIRMPFAAIGFASVVALIPGVLIFRAIDGAFLLASASGTKQMELAAETGSDAANAALIVIAMAVGLLVPERLFTHLSNSLRKP